VLEDRCEHFFGAIHSEYTTVSLHSVHTWKQLVGSAIGYSVLLLLSLL